MSKASDLAKAKAKKKVSKPTPAKPAPKAPDDANTRAIYGNKGVGLAHELENRIQPGSYGRLSTAMPGQQEVLDRMKAGLGGYTSPEMQAQREQMYKAQNSNYLTARNELAKAQARGKVYGAAGAAQLANLAESTQNSKNDLEQQLYVKNIDEQRSRLGEYGTATAAARAENRDVEAQNLAQQDAELADRQSAYAGGLGAAEVHRGNLAQEDISRQGIRALAAQTARRRTQAATPAA